MNKKMFIIIVLSVLVIFGLLFFQLNRDDTKKTPVATVFMTTEGFNPRELSIKQGQMVEFVNSEVDCSTSDPACNFWPASDVHPTHTIYPEFDPRQPIAGGTSWLFTFERVGNWGFHDHFNLKNKGVIRVLP